MNIMYMIYIKDDEILLDFKFEINPLRNKKDINSIFIWSCHCQC